MKLRLWSCHEKKLRCDVFAILLYPSGYTLQVLIGLTKRKNSRLTSSFEVLITEFRGQQGDIWDEVDDFIAAERKTHKKNTPFSVWKGGAGFGFRAAEFKDHSQHLLSTQPDQLVLTGGEGRESGLNLSPRLNSGLLPAKEWSQKMNEIGLWLARQRKIRGCCAQVAAETCLYLSISH